MVLTEVAGLNDFDACSKGHAGVDLYLLAETDDAEEIVFYNDLGASGTADDALGDLGASQTADSMHDDLSKLEDDTEVDLYLLAEADDAEERQSKRKVDGIGTDGNLDAYADDAADNALDKYLENAPVGDLDANEQDADDACSVWSDGTMSVDDLRCDLDATEAYWGRDSTSGFNQDSRLDLHADAWRNELEYGYPGDKYNAPDECLDSESGQDLHSDSHARG